MFHAWCEAGTDVDLDRPPTVWEQIEKFELDGPFWQMVKSSFGYQEDDPTLKNFLLRLFVTDFAHYLKGEVAPSLRPLLLPGTGWSNTVVYLAQWRDSSSKGSSYDRLSEEAANLLKFGEYLPCLELDRLLDVPTFLCVEKRIASCLKERVQATAETINAGEVRAIASRRQAGHWATTLGPISALVPRQVLHAVYDALVAAADYFALRKLHHSGLDQPDAASLYRVYESELFKFDQLYRRFCEAADQAEKEGWSILKPLRAELEKSYVNGYLPMLALAWGKFLEPQGGLLGKWQIGGVPNQQCFYDRHVLPWLNAGENRKAFVIISDAFRYEAAEELAAVLNGRYRLQADLTSQLGVMPSYTALGMASLLPHTTLAYKAGGSEVLVDGKSSVAGERDALLQLVGGMACKADDLMEKKKEDGREFVRDKRVVYIYHNRVDAIGDDSKTEGDAFLAVRQAIDELAALVVHIVNNLNGYYIIVTADHGFLFAETSPGEPDKSKLEEKPPGTLLSKKRYLLGRQLPGHPSVFHGKTDVTAGATGDMEFWIPKGTNRFHFSGGARFVHGGAMPQEIVVPVLTVKYVRGKSAQETKTKPVSVQVLGSNHRITTARHRFQLIQMEPVSDRIKAITLKIAVYQGEEPVTNVETVAFDSVSPSMDERKKWVNLVLKEREYDKKAQYLLV
ncbi:MAG: BREX-1 system phosphatase PglZ type A, partial [Deltaproteobacteria bacterium]|nr:BREX-1 system phosphatase PglZ type A [Deltaproteobacteria bacterium]